MLSVEHSEFLVSDKLLSMASDYQRMWVTRPQSVVYQRIYGLNTISVFQDANEYELLLDVIHKTLDSAGCNLSDVGVIVYTHTSPQIGVPGKQLVSWLRRQLGTDAEIFGTQSNKCVSVFSALQSMRPVLQANPGKKALLLMGELAESPNLRVVDGGIVGDAFACALLSFGSQHNQILSSIVHIHGEHAPGLYGDLADAKRYAEHYYARLKAVVDQALDEAGLTMQDISLLLPHNVNVNIWLKALDMLNLSKDRVFLDNIDQYGHCFGTDMLINLKSAETQNRLQKGQYFMMVSAGVGGVFGAAVLRH